MMKGDEKVKKKVMRILATLLVISCLTVPISALASTGSSITPYYNNTASTSTSMVINDTGLMTINYRYTGIPSTTSHATITTYVEKRTLGIFWTRVDIGVANDEWFDTINNYRYTGSRTFQLSKSGTYRVKVTYKIYGSGGAADEITYERTDSY